MPKLVGRSHRLRRRTRTSTIRHRQHKQRATVIGATGSGTLLERILSTPHVAHIVPQLQPEALYRVVKLCGLEDCGQLLTLATPGQLARVFDLDLWREAAPGLDEQFDADRFGSWVAVMVDADVAHAATTLAAMDVDLVATGFAQHVRVFDYAAASPFITLDGGVTPGMDVSGIAHCEIAGYLVCARQTGWWDAVTMALHALSEGHSPYFNQMMRRCCRQSNANPEVDGLDDLLGTPEQVMFDVAVQRESRRGPQGYVTPAHARAFLQMSRGLDCRHGAMPSRDAITTAYFRDLEPQPEVAREETSTPSANRAATHDSLATAAATIAALLNEGQLLARAPRALLAGGSRTTASRLARIHAHLQFAMDNDVNAYTVRSAELAYLANIIVAGSTIQSRAVTAEEASLAAMSICNLGLENWPAHWPPTQGTGRGFDLVTAFQVGCTVLHQDVCMYAAHRLCDVLAALHCADVHVHDSLAALRVEVQKRSRAGSPWNVGDAFDAIALLDTPSWAGVRALIAELPTMHAAIGASLTGTSHRIDASAFEFISENAQIGQVRDFFRVLPDLLKG